MARTNDWERREAERFYLDLIGQPGRRRPSRASSLETPRGQNVDAPGVSAGRVFDGLVYKGMTPESLLGGVVDSESWELVALPRTATPLDAFNKNDLVVQRALGESGLGSLHVVGTDIEAHELFGEDGLVRPNVAVLRPRRTRRGSRVTPDRDDQGEPQAARDGEPFQHDGADWTWPSSASEAVVDVAEADAPVAPAVRIEASPGLGTSNTVAPMADVSPQRQMNEILDREMILFARARILAEWIDRKFSSTIDQAAADPALMTRLDVSKDKKLRERLRPFAGGKLPNRRDQLFTTDDVLAKLLKAPKDSAALVPAFELLRDYGVVLLPPGPSATSRSVIASVTRVEARLERSRFDKESEAIERAAVQFKKDVANPGIFHHAIEAEAIPSDIWVDKAKPPLKVAKPVVALLRRLRERSKAWHAGTYKPHWWNDFSIDAFIIANVNKDDGFWARGPMREFFKALNAACEDTAAPGQFAWRAIYNDKPLAHEIDRLYGAGRVLQAEGHGPGPRMHVHLDLRPLTVPFDATTGFSIKDGRVVLTPPASSGRSVEMLEADDEHVEQEAHDISGEAPDRRAFTPSADAALFRTRPDPVAVTTATEWPEPTADADGASERALRALGVTAAGVATFSGAGLAALRPLAGFFGEAALIELLRRLRYDASQLIRPPHSFANNAAITRAFGTAVARPVILAMRTLLAIPGHFRQLARQAGNENEAYALENLGWLLLQSLRDDVHKASHVDFWLPSPPQFVTRFADPSPGLSGQTRGLVVGRRLIDPTLGAAEYRRRFELWRVGPAGRLWRLETGREAVPGRAAGAPFYAELFTIPPSIDIAPQRVQVQAAWARRLAAFEARLTSVPLTSCDNSYLTGLHLTARISLRGLELRSQFPSPVSAPALGTLTGLAAVRPAFEAAFQAIVDLGWNDLLVETQGMGCFRGKKIPGNPAAARRMSEHSLGIAIDLNVFENQQNTAGSMDPRIVALFEAFRFQWGKGFRVPDPMHFEYAG